MPTFLSRLLLTMALTVSLSATARDLAAETLDRHHDRLPSFSIDSVIPTLASRPLSPIEGVWQMTDDGAVFAISDSGDGDILVVMVDSPDRAILPGTVVGALVPTAKRGVYDACMKTDGETSLSTSRPFIFRLTDDSRLVITPVHNGFRLNLWRLLPYMFRYSVRRVNDRPRDIDGALRIYPRPENPPLKPRHL